MYCSTPFFNCPHIVSILSTSPLHSRSSSCASHRFRPSFEPSTPFRIPPLEQHQAHSTLSRDRQPSELLCHCLSSALCSRPPNLAKCHTHCKRRTRNGRRSSIRVSEVQKLPSRYHGWDTSGTFTDEMSLQNNSVFCAKRAPKRLSLANMTSICPSRAFTLVLAVRHLYTKRTTSSSLAVGGLPFSMLSQAL